ncbi:MAG: hypothetical protein ABT20_05480 [Rubrivivax sp. SCN 70-15]|nr:MAG: hypothetical protein ABT20_05480 [Rubrivivax sp. SCN 70-15]
MKRLALLLMMIALPALAAPPPVNLRVELRAVALDGQAAGAAPGDVVVGTRGGTPAGAGSQVLRSAPEAGDADAQVVVLNGATATLHARRLRALPTGDWVIGGASGSASGQPSGVGQTRQWIDAGPGIRVRPSWPGGAAPVVLDIAATGGQSAHTRLRVPLARWRGFARFGADDGTELQLRVSVAP